MCVSPRTYHQSHSRTCVHHHVATSGHVSAARGVVLPLGEGPLTQRSDGNQDVGLGLVLRGSGHELGRRKLVGGPSDLSDGQGAEDWGRVEVRGAGDGADDIVLNLLRDTGYRRCNARTMRVLQDLFYLHVHLRARLVTP